MCVEIQTYTKCYMHEMCVFRKFSERILSTKMCVENETYTICFMYECECLEKSPKICVEIVLKIFKVYTKVCCFYFLKESV